MFCSLAPVLRGEGWGEGLWCSHLLRLVVRDVATRMRVDHRMTVQMLDFAAWINSSESIVGINGSPRRRWLPVNRKRYLGEQD